MAYDDDTLTESLKVNLETGIKVGMSLFEANTPGSLIRDILLAVEPDNAEHALSTLPPGERAVFFDESKKVIEGNGALTELFNDLSSSLDSKMLTRFEASFIRGVLAGAIPSYQPPSTIEALGYERLSFSESVLLKQLAGTSTLEVSTGVVIDNSPTKNTEVVTSNEIAKNKWIPLSFTALGITATYVGATQFLSLGDQATTYLAVLAGLFVLSLAVDVLRKDPTSDE